MGSRGSWRQRHESTQLPLRFWWSQELSLSATTIDNYQASMRKSTAMENLLHGFLRLGSNVAKEASRVPQA